MLSLTDGETEAQGSLITCPRLYNRGMIGQGSESRSVDSEAGSLTCVVPYTELVGLIFINNHGQRQISLYDSKGFRLQGCFPGVSILVLTYFGNVRLFLIHPVNSLRNVSFKIVYPNLRCIKSQHTSGLLKQK